MNVKRARELLNKKIENLTDNEVEEMIIQDRKLVNMFLEMIQNLTLEERKCLKKINNGKDSLTFTLSNNQ